ncbi:MAG: endonuclease NucS [Deltaproteobacteria bacterium]|nr:endonuclease NucS [Deltaproteobacteria bacterium]
MKNYYRLMLGRKSVHAEACFAGGFVGTDFAIHQDLTGRLPNEWRDFNKEFIPIYLEKWPDKTKIAAGLACGAIWTVSKGMAQGDIVLCPDGTGQYRLGEIAGSYTYAQGQFLPHRRPVQWLDQTISTDDMSEGLSNSCRSIGTVSSLSKHAEEIEKLLQGVAAPGIVSTDPTVEDPTAFALEKHLEDFLVKNWKGTELSSDFDIYEEDGERVGQQFLTDTGPIDILAVSKDHKTLLVVELKKGRASDVVVGQLLRYMGFVQEELAEPEQTVRGVVIALEDDQRLRRALAMVPAIEFYRYEVSFKLVKV